MSISSWLVVDNAAWAAIAPADDAEAQPWHYSYHSAVTGFWADPPGETVYNCPGNDEQITALVDALNAHTLNAVSQRHDWDHGSGWDAYYSDRWGTDPAQVLALMKPHEVWEDDVLISSTPATYENPNFGHRWAGEPAYIFAGDFSNDFNEDFF